MTGLDYQLLALRTANTFDSPREQVLCSAIGMSDELGEVLGQIKKAFFQGHDLDLENVKEELGDMLWYVALFCNALDISLDDVMEINITKLARRYPEGFSTELSVHRIA